ncbi:nonribosomal peptide synthase [Fusarium austroafricanum]|uniref:Nonribosomal peptide synthase n=1 Tax=Fusarium austroafricanum TaxID=2364996 RepID=A0A8H4KNN2_9HYPO|nr:nonribosomal peptide synthase [Fusarium austroafricanum]
MTHALMDTHSISVVVQDLEEAFSEWSLPLRTPFRAYVEYVQGISVSERLSYWKQYLDGVKACHLPGDTMPASSDVGVDKLYQHLAIPASVAMSISRICVRKGRKSPMGPGNGMKPIMISEEDPHEYDVVLAATVNEDDTEVTVQYRTDFTSNTLARQVHRVVCETIVFLCSSLRQTSSPATEPLYDAFFLHLFYAYEDSVLNVWESTFHAVDICQFPSLPFTARHAKADASACYSIKDIEWRECHSLATQVIGCWAILQACYTRSQDIVLGLCPSDRDPTSADGFVCAPTPMRLTVDLNQDAVAYLDLVQSTIASHSDLPRLPLHRLVSISDELYFAYDFQTVLRFNGRYCDANKSVAHLQQALSLDFTTCHSGIKFDASFDEQIASSGQLTRFFYQLEAVIRQVFSVSSSALTLSDVDTVSFDDMRSISHWNDYDYDTMQDLVHHPIFKTVQKMPNALAVSAWDGEVTYRQLNELSSRLSYELVRLSVQPEMIIPIYSDKSRWVPVAVVSVMKVGGAYTMIDATERIEKASSILLQVSATTVLITSHSMDRAAQFQGVRLIAVDDAPLDACQGSDKAPASSPQHKAKPWNLAYVSFTWEVPQQALGFKSGQKVYGFASYSFDVSYSNLLHSLTSGSCLCIPSEFERINDLSGSIRDSRATLLNSTPSVLRHLDPSKLPDLNQVLKRGEAWSKWSIGQKDTRETRFYRTGDLVHYDSNGSFVFVDRKDLRVKIRGQRMQLGEVEDSIHKALVEVGILAQVIADVFTPYGSSGPILVAFLKPEEAHAEWHNLAGVEERMSETIPKYMIPTAYITMKEFPMTATAKIHRKALRETISLKDSFLRVGGDSLGAMRLVGAARRQNLALRVADISKHPKLSDLGQLIDSRGPDSQPRSSNVEFEPLSLIEGSLSRDEVRIQAASHCGIDAANVENVLPCTPLQAGLLTETALHTGDNILTELFVLRKHVDVDRFRIAWWRVMQANSILRTRIVDLSSEQVSSQEMGLGTPLISYQITNNMFSWSIHHALYDAWSMALIFECLDRSYWPGAIPDAPPSQPFLVHTIAAGFNSQKFPMLPSMV